MKFSANRAELAEAVKWVNAAISPRPPVPALAGLRITADAKASTVTLTGHDFDQVHEVTIAAEVASSGTLIPVGLMVRDLLALIKGDRVELDTVAGGGLGIKAGRSSYTVQCFSSKDWPTFPQNDIEDRGTVEADELRRCLVLAGAAGDDDYFVPRLRGVRLEGVGGELAVVGLQSTRASAAYAMWDGRDFESQVPGKNLGAAVKGLSGPVRLASSEAALVLTDGSHMVTLRAYAEMDYPQWRQLLGPGPQVVEVEAETLRDAVRRVATTFGARSGGVLETVVDKGVITLSAAGESAGGSESVDCTGGGSYTARWSSEVLLSVLNALPATEVTLAYGVAEGRSGNPQLIVTDKDGTFSAVVAANRGAAA